MPSTDPYWMLHDGGHHHAARTTAMPTYTTAAECGATKVKIVPATPVTSRPSGNEMRCPNGMKIRQSQPRFAATRSTVTASPDPESPTPGSETATAYVIAASATTL